MPPLVILTLTFYIVFYYVWTLVISHQINPAASWAQLYLLYYPYMFPSRTVKWLWLCKKRGKMQADCEHSMLPLQDLAQERDALPLARTHTHTHWAYCTCIFMHEWCIKQQLAHTGSQIHTEGKRSRQTTPVSLCLSIVLLAAVAMA